jgi:hypothetical protein
VLSLRTVLVLALLAAAGCTDPAPPDGPAIIGGVARIELPLFTTRNVDLLFVIDNSPVIAPQRAKLLDNYRRFIDVLETFPGGLYDLHIGVVTADVGTRGAFDSSGPSIGTGPGSCTSEGDRGELRRAPSIDGNFLFDIARPDGTRERNYTGSLADAFVQLADVGAAGCIYPRPLEAMQRALGNPANEGFRRDDALLAVVLLTNDDDCSFGSWSAIGTTLDRSQCTTNAGALVPIDRYVAALHSSTVAVLGAFASPGAPACADASPAPRLAAFLDAFPSRSGAASICGSDLGAPLSLVRQIWPRLSLALPCFGEPVLDVDPAADGLQADCAAWYSYRDRGAPVERLIPACRGDAPGPCWQLRRDPQLCAGELVEFRDHPRGFDGESGARAIIECVSR